MKSHVTKAHHSYNHLDLGDTPAIHEAPSLPPPNEIQGHPREPWEGYFIDLRLQSLEFFGN